MSRVSERTAIAVVLACVLSSILGCTEERSLWFTEATVENEAESVPEVDAPPLAEPADGRFRVHSHFEGYADPENGIFELWTVDPDPTESSRDGQFATAEQPLWCEMTVFEDGDENTSLPETIQIHTEANTVFSHKTGCRGVTVEGDVSTGMVGAADMFQMRGVFCANVTAANFYTRDLGTVVVEIDYHSGTSDQFAHSKATGGNAEVFDFGSDSARPQATYGMWVLWSQLHG